MHIVRRYEVDDDDWLAVCPVQDGRVSLVIGRLHLEMGVGMLAALRDQCDRSLAGVPMDPLEDAQDWFERRALDVDAIEEGP